MKVSLRSLLAPSLALSLCFSAPQVSAQTDEQAQTWQMFAHFVNVARPEQARPFGERLLAMDNASFLAAIEADRLREFEEVGEIGIADSLKPLWQQIQDKRQEALTERSRDVDRIRADIMALGEGRTKEFLAIQRLKATGQFAAPYYLETLMDPDNRRLKPRVVNAMIEVGSELAYPLAVAMPGLPPATQVTIANVLGEIGYPEALPYLKQVTELETNTNVKAACQAAFSKIAESAGVDASGTAAELYIRVGEAKYSAGTRGDEILGMDLGNDQGIIWRFDQSAGLFAVPVAQSVYADSLAMQAAKFALELNSEMDEAVTLHLASNLRRENTLAGTPDPGYNLPNPASFYLLIAGADQQKAVLSRGLNDGDTELALDATKAMAQTVGNSVLLGSNDTRAPVLDALVYGDRRVRYTAAITLASAEPEESFSGSVSVVPVLGQAVRQSDTLNAVVVAASGSDALVSLMDNIDYAAVGAADLPTASTRAIAAMPGVDLLVYAGDFAGFQAFYNSAKANGQLSVTPILALVDSGVASAIKVNYDDVQTAAPITGDADAELDRLERLAKQTIETFGGEPISSGEAETFAVTALDLLRTIAGHDSIYNAGDVETILIEALDDNRASVATGAGHVLERLDSATAQQGLAKAALARVGDVQVSQLNSLADSARSFGNKLERDTTDQLITLVNSASGETALAAARALGALTERPTSDTSKFILKK